jgi:hypothetical protein
MKYILHLSLFGLLLGISAKSQTSLGLNNPQSKTDTISAFDLASIQFDSNITSFEIGFVNGDVVVEWEIEGNRIPLSDLKMIINSNPGEKIIFSKICAAKNGQTLHLPDRTYIIR